MKYLIDGWTKNVQTMAKNYSFLPKGNSYTVYDDGFKIQDFDLTYLTRITNNNGEYSQDGLGLNEVTTDERGYSYVQRTEEDWKEQDQRRFLSSIDFEGSLEWCDVYCNFQSIDWMLANSRDTVEEGEKIDKILNRIELAKAKGKKVFLGNMFSADFEKTVRTYDNCINHILTKKDLEEIEQYRGNLFSTDTNISAEIVMISGTNSNSGKFSSAFMYKEILNSLECKTVILATEETGYFFEGNEDIPVYTMCRNFSDLTIDEEFMYLQGLIGKILTEQKPDKIIIVGQGSFGFTGFNRVYDNTLPSRKMHGVWDTLIEQAVGANGVVLCCNYDRISAIEREIEYFKILNIPIHEVFVSPVNVSAYSTSVKITDDLSMPCSTIGTPFEVEAWIRGLMVKYPDIDFYTDYASIQPKLDAFRNDKLSFYNSVYNYKKAMLEVNLKAFEETKAFYEQENKKD